MIYKVAFKASVGRDLKKIDADQARRILKKIETDLSAKADQLPTLTGKFTGMRRYRVGDYRVIYTILEDTVLVLRISHRRESYR